MTWKRTEFARYIVGYALGIGVFGIAIPYGMIRLSSMKYNIFEISMPLSEPTRIIVSLFLFIIGMVFVVWSNISLVLKGKGGPTDIFGVAITPRTKRLVVTGPYRFTRHPMVFGMLSMYLSIAVYLNSLGTLLALSLFIVIVIGYLKLIEEKRLLGDFGEEYTEYKKRTSMLIPFPSKQGMKEKD
jgi:protein-S-isoprenylcysteine O-methyltransferase Ste14